jgi:hypothetical protein
VTSPRRRARSLRARIDAWARSLPTFRTYYAGGTIPPYSPRTAGDSVRFRLDPGYTLTPRATLLGYAESEAVLDRAAAAVEQPWRILPRQVGEQMEHWQARAAFAVLLGAVEAGTPW